MSTDIIDESLILTDLEGTNKEEILEAMARNMYKEGVVKESFIEAVIQREASYPTGLPTEGYSVAIPHTDIEHVNKKAISLGILKNTVDFRIMGEDTETTPVKVVLMLAMDQKHSHLSLLTHLIQIIQDKGTLLYMAQEKNKTKLKDALIDKLKYEMKEVN